MHSEVAKPSQPTTDKRDSNVLRNAVAFLGPLALRSFEESRREQLHRTGQPRRRFLSESAARFVVAIDETTRRRYRMHVVHTLEDNRFRDIIQEIRRITTPPRYIVGGVLYRGIAQREYGYGAPWVHDIDAIVNATIGEPDPLRYNAERNMYGGLKIRSLADKKRRADVWTFDQHVAFKALGTAGNIDNFLLTVPLNIQCIAWNLDTAELLGDAGLDAVATRTIAVHHEAAYAQYVSERRKKFPESDELARIARELRFETIDHAQTATRPDAALPKSQPL